MRNRDYVTSVVFIINDPFRYSLIPFQMNRILRVADRNASACHYRRNSPKKCSSQHHPHSLTVTEPVNTGVTLKSPVIDGWTLIRPVNAAVTVIEPHSNDPVTV
jgi:hypothetical protein